MSVPKEFTPTTEWTTVRIPRWAYDKLVQAGELLEQHIKNQSRVPVDEIMEQIGGKKISRGVVVGAAAMALIHVLSAVTDAPHVSPATKGKPR